ncbi:hypothetical protein CsatB_025311 [Cannabis sativa]
MVTTTSTNSDEFATQMTPKAKSDRQSELKAFDDTKAGVKGLVDSGITKIPTFFHHPSDQSSLVSEDTQVSIPVIDLKGIINGERTREDVIKKVREASELWGFFQIVNHGIPIRVLEEMKDGVRCFYEQEDEIKEYYTRDISEPFVYNSNFDLYITPCVNWRDTFTCFMAPHPPNPQDLPLLITNDKFKSNEHRVLASKNGPRISVASFFSTNMLPTSKVFGPIKELLSENNSPKYKEITLRDYNIFSFNKGLDGIKALDHFKL